ncbi:hypothetical protein N8230_01145 [Gammaproteobacteria bacterium]|jgi:hypothetical protein|nr:hypothetical protein [Gammaproteobacteria bacterium]
MKLPTIKTIQTEFNDEIVEFFADSSEDIVVDYEIFEELLRCKDGMDQETHFDIWGPRNPVNVIQIDAHTYWRVILMSRHLKEVTDKFHSVSKCIEILTMGSKFLNLPSKRQRGLFEDNQQDKYKQLSRLLKGLSCVVCLDTSGMMFFNTANPKEDENIHHSLHELYIPDITWNHVPLFRFILLGHMYPELLSGDEWQHLSWFVNNSKTNHLYSPDERFGQVNDFYESDIDIDNAVHEAKIYYPKILKENEEIKKSSQKLTGEQKLSEHYFRVLSKTSDEMKDSFIKKFELLKKFPHKGRYKEIKPLFYKSTI